MPEAELSLRHQIPQVLCRFRSDWTPSVKSEHRLDEIGHGPSINNQQLQEDITEQRTKNWRKSAKIWRPEEQIY